MTTLTIQLTVTSDQGKPRIPLEISESVTVADLLQQVSNATRIPPSTLKVIYRGKLVRGTTQAAVAEFKLENDSVLHCIGKPETSVEPKAASSSVSSTTPATAAVASVPSLIPLSSAAAPTDPSATASAHATPLEAALAHLRAHNSQESYLTAVTTLDKLLDNIIQNPLEEKYRRIKKSNPAFCKRLGTLAGGDGALKACGFVETTIDSEPFYSMQASADAWPALLRTKQTVNQAAMRASSNTPSNVPPAAAFPSTSAQLGLGGDSGFPNLPGMHEISPMMQVRARQIMSNPQQLRAMLQNPVVLNMMRNDPRFANFPNVQQALSMIQNHPEMLAQMSQMMMDHRPGVPGSSGPTSTTTSATANANATAGANDALQTEEEMIAEAIRRSLEDSNNGGAS